MDVNRKTKNLVVHNRPLLCLSNIIYRICNTKLKYDLEHMLEERDLEPVYVVHHWFRQIAEEECLLFLILVTFFCLVSLLEPSNLLTKHTNRHHK